MKDVVYKRSTILTILSTLGVLIYIHPELRQLIRDEPIGNGISELIVGALALSLVFGIRVIDWAGKKKHLSHVQDDVALLALVSVVIGGNLLVLYYIPDSPEAIGVLLVIIPGALIVLHDTLSRVTSSD